MSFSGSTSPRLQPIIVILHPLAHTRYQQLGSKCPSRIGMERLKVDPLGVSRRHSFSREFILFSPQLKVCSFLFWFYFPWGTLMWRKDLVSQEDVMSQDQLPMALLSQGLPDERASIRKYLRKFQCSGYSRVR